MQRKVPVFDLEGRQAGEVELPPQFFEPIRTDLIRRAVISILTARLQPKGTDPLAGKRRVIHASGKHAVPGGSRDPRGYGPGGALIPVFAPHVRKGRRAHPPKVEKILHEEINKKEKRAAVRSAIAATAVWDLVRERGHLLDGVRALPLVVVPEFEQLKKTKEVRKVLQALGVWADIEKSQESKRYRAGKGKMRGRRYKVRKSVLIVYGSDKSIYYAARNLPGVDVVHVKQLNAALLAPGAVPGRLTLWTLPALELLDKERLFY
ncbi:MAG: 50S ribosomal protein L4 [bacterium]|nr:50S ribosomal protein L4 [bacterium]